jgi:hypothetical protein
LAKFIFIVALTLLGANAAPAPVPKLFRKKRWLFGPLPTTTPRPTTTTTTEGPKDLNGTFQVADCGEKNNFICMVDVPNILYEITKRLNFKRPQL